ncbi:acyl-CoA dehydrogenase family protein [Pantoea stewartii]|uniref:acyl-CoA dehydrogenase family protein n=1 Tax=Pantoea stewartii TaxID=66269 RepID=UPI0021E7E851|nr:acyl-CoA dehydrogenase [Pantoea stewartii]UYK98840.1 acyl-CoA dehydrogenase [Pantoea stewartii]
MKKIYQQIQLRNLLQIGDDAELIAERIRKANDPDCSRSIIAEWSFASALNQLGLPADPSENSQSQQLADISLTQRLKLYENIGYVSPALIFLAPGPGMAAFVIAGLGTAEQQRQFFAPFRQGLHWSCFAMTEPGTGSDARAMRCQAERVKGGFRLSGEKMLIGNGTLADIGVVFARTAEGSLGVDAFIFHPQSEGVRRRRLHLNGLDGISLARLTFDNLFIPDEQALGQHLKPTERFARSAMATFDALRPCVGAIALGVARRALDDWQYHALAACPGLSGMFCHAGRELDAAYLRASRLCQQLDEHLTPDCTPGMSKTHSVKVAESIITRLIHALPAEITTLHHRLWQAYRDVKAFEYTEGTRQIHLLNHTVMPLSEAY